MNQWLAVFNSPEGLTISLLFASFVLGILGTITSCCNVAIIGAVAGYSGTLNIGQNKRKLLLVNLSFFLGIFLSFIIIGLIIGFAGQKIADSIGPYWKILTGVILIFAGVFSLGFVKIKIPSLSPKKESAGSGFWTNILFGLTIGGASTVCTACCSPVFPVILGASFLQHDYLRGLLVIVFFSIGYSLPFLLILTGLGLSFDKMSKRLNNFGIYLKYIAGIVMIGFGFYFLITF